MSHNLERELLMRLMLGDLKANGPVPDERALAAHFKVDVRSVRAALGRLVSCGVLEKGQGPTVRVAEQPGSFGIDTMLDFIADRAEAERGLTLEAQLLDLMSVVFLEVIYRSAACRTEEQLRWYRHWLRVLHDRVDLDSHVSQVADAQFQLLRVLAASAGSIAFSVLLCSLRAYLCSPAGLELFPLEIWSQLARALEQKDVARARHIFQRCFDVRTARVLERLADLRS